MFRGNRGREKARMIELDKIVHHAGTEGCPTFFSQVDPGGDSACVKCGHGDGLMYGHDNSCREYTPIWVCDPCMCEIMGVLQEEDL